MGDKSLKEVLPGIITVVLIGAGVVSCNVAFNHDPVAPPEDPFAYHKVRCEQIGGRYVPAPATPSLPTFGNGYRQRADMPKCLRADGVEITFKPGPNLYEMDPGEPIDP